MSKLQELRSASSYPAPSDTLASAMKKVGLVFVLAVIAPSLVLAWLAVRSLRDQKLVADRQQTLLYQSLADAKASAVARHLADAQQMFRDQVQNLLRAEEPRQ